ncbi:NUDIX hydrolase [Yoonia sp. SS1-5]|uniref:NUDIX hydrolase n=1 Tax=Yoonia rhodophyticola TaxID=3137370 RepID=A0AAN0NI98_9RHOB
MFQTFWAGTLRPLFHRDSVLQVAALCWRAGDDGIEVLLINSSAGRWILPKGWPMDDRSDAEAAKQEAWEEAGVKDGDLVEQPIGSFLSTKEFKNGAIVPCETKVFEIAVTAMVSDFPESDRRQVRWVTLDTAAKMVSQDGLARLLRNFRPT